jgi:hypothetical protein
MGALLRDIGKVVIPGAILDKPTDLAAEEWQAIVQHPQLGQVILERAASLREVAPIVLHHHEHYSGQGYPHGLRGSEIPLGARIVSIADAYDAMVQDRPYRARIGHEAALRELRRNAGSQFDPSLVELFCQLYAEAPPVADPSVAALAGSDAGPDSDAARLEPRPGISAGRPASVAVPASMRSGASRPAADLPAGPAEHPAEDAFASGILARRPAI